MGVNSSAVTILILGFSLCITGRSLGPPRISKDALYNIEPVALEGDQLKLPCKVEGRPRPHKVWYRNGVPLNVAKDERYTFGRNELKIFPIKKEDEGIFSCHAHNEHGELWLNYTVSVYTVNESTLPVIVGPTDQTVRTGSDARLECKVMPNDLQHHTQWLQHYMINGSYKDSSGQPNVNIIQQSGPNISHPEILILKNVTLADAGRYTCLVSNPLGRDYQSAWLTVLEDEVEVVDYPEDECDKERFGEGLPFFPDPKPGTWIARSRFSPVEMRCKACGSPEPTIRWYKNHQYIQPDVVGGRLEIDSMDKEDEGNYTCVVENKFGKINATFKVEVLFNATYEKAKEGNRTNYLIIGISVGSSIFGALISTCVYRYKKLRKRSNITTARPNINDESEVQYDEIDDSNPHEMAERRVIQHHQDTTRPTNPQVEAETENTNLVVASANNNVATDAHYDEIHDDTLYYEINDFGATRHTDSRLLAETESANPNIASRGENVTIVVHYNEIDEDNLHEMSDIRASRQTDSRLPADTENATNNVTNENTVVEENEDGVEAIMIDKIDSEDSSDIPRNGNNNVSQSAVNQYQILVDSQSGDMGMNSYDQLNAGNRF